MTFQQAVETVRAYGAHSWAYEVTADGTVVVGGQDHSMAVAEARAAGHDGPVHRVYG